MKKFFSHTVAFLGVFWIFLFVLDAPAFALTEQKTAFIWGKTISYELQMIHNPAVKYDGEAYIRMGNHVVLNTAYIRKEAEGLWDTFQSSSKPAWQDSLSLQEVLASLTLLNHRDTFSHQLSSSEKKKLLSTLEKLEAHFAYAAWYPTYRQTTGKEAFVRSFIRTRKNAILYHELSHLVDQEEWGAKKHPGNVLRNANLFAFHTEVRAFLAELAYGDNPHDVLWQVLTGVVEELQNGQNIDYSIRKLTGVLHYAENAETMTSLNGIDLFKALCFISRGPSKAMAFLLYRDYPVIL